MLVKLKVKIVWQGETCNSGDVVELPERMAKAYIQQGDGEAVKEPVSAPKA